MRTLNYNPLPLLVSGPVVAVLMLAVSASRVQADDDWEDRWEDYQEALEEEREEAEERWEERQEAIEEWREDRRDALKKLRKRGFRVAEPGWYGAYPPPRRYGVMPPPMPYYEHYNGPVYRHWDGPPAGYYYKPYPRAYHHRGAVHAGPVDFYYGRTNVLRIGPVQVAWD